MSRLPSMSVVITCYFTFLHACSIDWRLLITLEATTYVTRNWKASFFTETWHKEGIENWFKYQSSNGGTFCKDPFLRHLTFISWSSSWFRFHFFTWSLLFSFSTSVYEHHVLAIDYITLCHSYDWVWNVTPQFIL